MGGADRIPCRQWTRKNERCSFAAKWEVQLAFLGQPVERREAMCSAHANAYSLSHPGAVVRELPRDVRSGAVPASRPAAPTSPSLPTDRLGGGGDSHEPPSS